MPMPLPTEFAPAELADAAALRRQIGAAARNFDANSLSGAVPALLLILNAQRQIVYANQSVLNLLKLDRASDLFGQRPGEAFHCMHALAAPQGCGTTAFCRTCGSVQAILTAQQGRPDVQECRIIAAGDEALDLRIWTTPMEINGEKFTIFAVLDIRDEKRRRALERIFFHDIMNVAAGLRGFTDLLETSQPDDARRFQAIIRDLAGKLIEDIQAQRDLANAESNDLVSHPVPVQSRAMIAEVAGIYKHLSDAKGVVIALASAAPELAISSDKVLLRRVLGNLVKNAVEASQPGDTVTLDCRDAGAFVEFTVHNPGVIPPDVQLQLFQRSFSTKGAGRGLGTYSVKLLTERYLQGTVTFSSSAEQGTIFTARYPRQPAAANAG